MKAFLITKKQLENSSCFYIGFVLFSDGSKRSNIDDLGSLQSVIKFA